jgi:hypothetical protein
VSFTSKELEDLQRLRLKHFKESADKLEVTMHHLTFLKWLVEHGKMNEDMSSAYDQERNNRNDLSLHRN